MQLSPGTQLAAARERAGWTAERLAAELCLPIDRLQALERDDHASFGGVVFVRGYLRRAAGLLGIPPQELIAAFENCCDTTRPAEILPGLAPGQHSRRGLPAWAGSVAGVAVVAAVLAGSWWLLSPDAEHSAGSETLSQAPAAAGLEFIRPEEPRVVASETAPETPPETAPEPGPAADPVETIEVAAAAPASTGELPQPVATVVEIPEPAAPPPGTTELRFEFSEDCWLEVHDADERQLAYRLYRAGDVARLRGKAPVGVFLGNAEGVRLTVDGAAIAVRPAARRDGTARLTVGGGAG
jgi:cytoskeleton protein RodZ